MKRIVKVLEVLFLVFMIGMCGVVFMAGNGKVPYIFGYRILQVISNSMAPTIETETCIIIKQVEPEDIEIGDVITFTSEDPSIRGYLNTHRVHDITKDEETGETLYITKGDAYDQPDIYPVEYEQVAGEFVSELPFGRQLFKGIRFLADRNNYFIIVMLPLFCCFASYAKQLMEALSGKGKDKDEDDDDNDIKTEKNKSKGNNKGNKGKDKNENRNRTKSIEDIDANEDIDEIEDKDKEDEA